MERVAWWLWRRGKQHFEAYILVTAVLMIVVIVVWPGVGLAAMFFSVTWRGAVAWEVVASAVVVLSIPILTAMFGRRFFTLVRAWVAGDVHQAEEVHRAALTAPRTISIRVGFVVLPCEIFTAGVVGARVSHQSWGGFVTISFAIVLLVMMGVAVVGLGFEQLTLPLRTETAFALGGGAAARSRWGVVPRLLAVAWLTACMVGVATAEVTTLFATDESRFAAALVTAVASATLFVVGYFRSLGCCRCWDPSTTSCVAPGVSVAAS